MNNEKSDGVRLKVRLKRWQKKEDYRPTITCIPGYMDRLGAYLPQTKKLLGLTSSRLDDWQYEGQYTRFTYVDTILK